MTYTETVQKWKSYNISSVAELEQRLDSFRVLFAYNSSKIENPLVDYHDTREIFENGRVLNYSGSTRALFEQQNQKLCYEYLKEKIITREQISLPLITEVHRILTSGTYDERRFIVNEERPGEFKKHDYVTGINEVGAAVDEVVPQLTELLGELNAHDGSNTLKAAAYFHAVFENIHPFADGNGRVGRTLMNYYLMINDHPPIIVYEDEKRDYYEALRLFDEQENLDGLVLFLQAQTERTWAKAMARRCNCKDEREV